MIAWSEARAADELGVSERQLADARRNGKAPPHRRIGRTVLYDPDRVKEWLARGDEAQADRGHAAVRPPPPARRGLDDPRFGGHKQKRGRRVTP